MKLKKYTLEELKDALATSVSYRQTLDKLGVTPAGGNYSTLRKAITHFNLDTSHLKGQGWNKGKNLGPKRPIEDYLSNKHSCTSHRLRKRLIEENFFEAKCYNCGQAEWLGNPIPLELEHIDGNHQNNTLENLTILCPNCHALTPTYRGRNKGSY
jgi:hypothetical protein